MSDSVYYRPQQSITLSDGTDTDVNRHRVERIYEGLVRDVILDHRHDQYSRARDGTGYNVGSIQVRIFDTYQGISGEDLPWADPIDKTFSQLPLIGEIVQLIKIRNNLFYTTSIPLSRRLQENAMIGVENEINNRVAGSGNSELVSGETVEANFHNYGNYFQPDSRVRQLLRSEGDTLIESRFGSSIRFGSSKLTPLSEELAPNILIRAGQAPDVEIEKTSADGDFGLILEDINKDESSLWMTTNQVVPFLPSTVLAGSFYRSIREPTGVYDRSSIILNSGRLVLNSKNDHTLIFSDKEIYLNSIGRTAIDTDESLILTANLNIEMKSSRNIETISDGDFSVITGEDISLISSGKSSILGSKTFIGSISDDSEPMVAGTSLSKFLARMIQVLMGTGIAPIGVDPAPAITPGIAATAHGVFGFVPVQLNPIIISGLATLYTELTLPNIGSRTPVPFSGAPFNSQDNFVKKVNENSESVIVLNEFEDGERLEKVENNWEIQTQT